MQLYRLFQRYAPKAGIDMNVYPHMARATMITSAYEAECLGEGGSKDGRPRVNHYGRGIQPKGAEVSAECVFKDWLLADTYAYRASRLQLRP